MPHRSDLRSCLLALFPHFSPGGERMLQKLPVCLFATLLILRRDSRLAIILDSADSNFYQRVFECFIVMLDWRKYSKLVVYCMFHKGHGLLLLSWQQKRSQCKDALGRMRDLYGCHFALTTKKGLTGWIKQDRWFCLCTICLCYMFFWHFQATRQMRSEDSRHLAVHFWFIQMKKKI